MLKTLGKVVKSLARWRMKFRNSVWLFQTRYMSFLSRAHLTYFQPPIVTFWALAKALDFIHSQRRCFNYFKIFLPSLFSPVFLSPIAAISSAESSLFLWNLESRKFLPSRPLRRLFLAFVSIYQGLGHIIRWANALTIFLLASMCEAYSVSEFPPF